VLEVLEIWKGNPSRTIELDLGENYGASYYSAGDEIVAFLQRGEANAARQRAEDAEYLDILRSILDEQPQIVEDDPDFPKSPEEIEAMRRQSEVAFDAFERWMVNRWSLLRIVRLDKYPEASDREALTDIIRRAVKLQADGADAAARLDWHVTAAVHRATRYEGFIELFFMIPPQRVDPPETFVSEDEPGEDTDQPAWEPEVEPTPMLTDEQLKRLAEGFAREPAVDQTDLTMLRLLAGYPDLEVDRTAAAVIEAGLLMRPIPDWVLEMVDEALKRYGDDFAARIGRDDSDPRGRPIYTGEGENTLPTIWEVARRDLGIPQVLPAVAPVREEPPR